MLEILGKGYCLVTRGDAGLSCDESGVSLGGIALVERQAARSTRAYAVIDGPRLSAVLTSAYEQLAPAEIHRIEARLNAIADALNAGSPCVAMIAAVQMRLPELSAHAVRRLAKFQKEYNPSQPRVAAGNPGGGEWTSDPGNQLGGARRPTRTAQIPLPMPLPIPIPGLPSSPVPNIPFPHLFDPPPVNPFQDRPECVEEWREAYRFCGDLMRRRLLKPGFRGFGKDFNRCVLGQVSADCGGNPTGEG